MQQLHAACICTHVVSYQPGAVEVQTVLLLLLYGLKSSRSCSLPWQQCGSRDSVTETPTHFNPNRFRQTLSTTHRRLIPCKGYLNTHQTWLPAKSRSQPPRFRSAFQPRQAKRFFIIIAHTIFFFFCGEIMTLRQQQQ